MYPYSDQNKKRVCYENLLLIDTYQKREKWIAVKFLGLLEP